MESIFTEGSWWTLDGEQVVCGGPALGQQRGRGRVYLYRIGDELPVCFLTEALARRMVQEGSLVPEITDFLE